MKLRTILFWLCLPVLIPCMVIYVALSVAVTIVRVVSDI